MNPYEQYQKQMVTTMTQGEMLLKLYDEILRQIDFAKVSIQSGNVEEMNKTISKAQKILRHLQDNLDHRYPISNNLSQLYSFFTRELMFANIRKDSKHLDDIRPLILDLRNTYEQCDKIERSNRNKAAGNHFV